MPTFSSDCIADACFLCPADPQIIIIIPPDDDGPKQPPTPVPNPA